LKDVAEARESVENERTTMRFWVARRQAAGGDGGHRVYRQAGTKRVEVSRQSRAAAEVLRRCQQRRIKPIYDRSATIVNSVRT